MIRVDPSRLHRVVEIADEAVREGIYPSAVVLVANSERFLLKHVAVRPDRVPAREDSIFLLASITKPVVATAIMRLVEEGRLLLNDPVAKYIPEFAAAEKGAVTVAHILSHTSGLNDDAWIHELTAVQRATIPQLVEMACAAPLRFAPGSQYQYNSFSFYILSELISRLSGTPYDEYLRNVIFKPLGMRDTGFAIQALDRVRAMTVYSDEPDMDRRLSYYVSLAFPGGGLWSTAADLVAFGRTLLRGGTLNGYHLLSPVAIDVMTRQYTGELREEVNGLSVPANAALGWKKPRPESLASPSAYRHGGVTGTLLHIDPEWDLVFVFLTNYWGIQGTAPDQALHAVYGAMSRN